MKVHKSQDAVLKYEFKDMDLSLLRNIHIVIKDTQSKDVARYAMNPQTGYNSVDTEIMGDVIEVRVSRSVIGKLYNKTYVAQIMVLINDPEFRGGYRVISDARPAFTVVEDINETDTGVPSLSYGFNLDLEVRNIIDSIYGGLGPNIPDDGILDGGEPGDISTYEMDGGEI